MVGGTDYDGLAGEPGDRHARRWLGAASRGRRSRRSRSPRPCKRATRSSRSTTSPSRISIPNANAGQDWNVDDGCCGGQRHAGPGDAELVNTVFAQLMVELGARQRGGAGQRLGVTAPLDPPRRPRARHRARSRVLDMASAYSTLRRQRRARRRRARSVRVTDANGAWSRASTPSGPRCCSGDQTDRVRLDLQRCRRERHRHGGEVRTRRPARPARPGLPGRMVRRATPASSPRWCGWATRSRGDAFGPRLHRARRQPARADLAQVHGRGDRNLDTRALSDPTRRPRPARSPTSPATSPGRRATPSSSRHDDRRRLTDQLDDPARPHDHHHHQAVHPHDRPPTTTTTAPPDTSP